MALIDTNTMTPREIATALWTAGLLDKVKAVEEETSTISKTYDEHGRKKQWIEETRDLDGYLVSKRIEDHTYLPDGRTNTITHRVYDGAELYKQWIVNDQTHKITIEVQHVRRQYYSQVSEATGQITPGKNLVPGQEPFPGEPTGDVTIMLDGFPLGLGCLVCGLGKDGFPDGSVVYGVQRFKEEPIYDPETGEIIGTSQVAIPQKVLYATLDMAGNYILNDEPESPPVALVYIGEIRVG